MLEFVNLLNYLALAIFLKTANSLYCSASNTNVMEKCNFRKQQILIKNSVQKLEEIILISMEKNIWNEYQIKQIINIYEMDFAAMQWQISVLECLK